MTVTVTKKGGPDDEVGMALGVQNTAMVSATFVKKTPLKKAERELLDSNALTIVDQFNEADFDPAKNPKAAVIAPPFDMIFLGRLIQNNNALGQCIAAMEVNIDGTGYEVELADDTAETDEEDETGEGIKDFFDEVFPGESFITLRRRLRVDLESVGNAYIEVLRSVKGDITFLKCLPAASVRIIRLDDPVPVTREVERFGEVDTITMMMRERRFVQKFGSRLVYFKEFGSSRDLDKLTGLWAEEGVTLPALQKGTELIHLTTNTLFGTPYGIPRWIPQVPSVLGSRKAEELNLDFFNAGGLPPALIMIQGGSMVEEVRKQLQSYLTGKGNSKHRAAIIETFSTSGSLDSASGGVRVTVERFGSERQNDSMFENYDAKCEKRVRASFRLPPLFVGRAEEYNFATAFASYAVAEAQVFQPERTEFDEMINVTIMKEIAPDYIFRSLPLNIKDVTNQLKGLDMVKEQVDGSMLVTAVNEIVDTNLKPKEGVDDPEPTDPNQVVVPGGATAPRAGAPIPSGLPAAPISAPVTMQQKMDAEMLLELASDWAAYSAGDLELEQESVDVISDIVKQLDASQRGLFDSYVTMRMMSGFDYDREGITELCSHATEILNKASHPRTGRCPPGQHRSNGRCVPNKTATEKAEHGFIADAFPLVKVGDLTGIAGNAEGGDSHTHVCEEGGMTSEDGDNPHRHTWESDWLITGITNEHSHSLAMP